MCDDFGVAAHATYASLMYIFSCVNVVVSEAVAGTWPRGPPGGLEAGFTRWAWRFVMAC
jgi:hypothetical protein